MEPTTQQLEEVIDEEPADDVTDDLATGSATDFLHGDVWVEDYDPNGQETQASPMQAMQTVFESELIGIWHVSTADHEWFADGDTVSFQAGGTGVQGTTDFNWHVEIVERPHLPDGDFLELVMYFGEFDMTIVSSFPVIENHYLTLSDYTGMSWAEFIRD